MQGYFITGTDTDVGKTVAAAWAMIHTDGYYWKPVQSGQPYDRDTIKNLTQFSDDRFYDSTYILNEPLSPHEAARRDGVTISMDQFKAPSAPGPLIVEGAGGLMVPLNQDHMVIDLIAHLDLPAILVCRSLLGTINHTLLSLNALRTRHIDIAGLIISGPTTPHNRQALEEFGRVPVIAELDHFKPVSKMALSAVPPETALTAKRIAA